MTHWFNYEASLKILLFGLILGIPDWIFWSVVAPWIIVLAFSVWFCFAYMADDDLGQDQGEGAPHAAVPVQLAIAVKQPDARMVSRDGLRGAVRAVVVENEDVEGNAGRPLGEQGIQARERQLPTIVHCHDRGDTNAGHLGSLRRVTFV